MNSYKVFFFFWGGEWDVSLAKSFDVGADSHHDQLSGILSVSFATAGAEQCVQLHKIIETTTLAVMSCVDVCLHCDE